MFTIRTKFVLLLWWGHFRWYGKDNKSDHRRVSPAAVCGADVFRSSSSDGIVGDVEGCARNPGSSKVILLVQFNSTPVLNQTVGNR